MDLHVAGRPGARRSSPPPTTSPRPPSASRASSAVNRTIIAHGPSVAILDPDVLARMYGGHLLVLGGQTVVLDDAHHHDDAPGKERHFHEGGGSGRRRVAPRASGALMDLVRRRVFLARALAAGPDLFLLDEPVTGVDATTQEDLMDILEAEARGGRPSSRRPTTSPARRSGFQQVATVNRTIIAHGPSSLILDPDVLARTYGGHLLVLGGADRRPRRRPSPRRRARQGTHFHEGGGPAAGRAASRA